MEPITRKEIYLNQIARNTGGSGGDTGLTPITREEHYFDAIVKNTASGGGGGGSSLPAVTAADNGDVLTVVNGAWDKAAPSGGGDYPGWDVVIQAKQDDNTGEYEFNILKGNFSTAWAKGSAGLPVMVFVYVYVYVIEDNEEQFMLSYDLNTSVELIPADEYGSDMIQLLCTSIEGSQNLYLTQHAYLSMEWTADGITNF